MLCKMLHTIVSSIQIKPIPPIYIYFISSPLPSADLMHADTWWRRNTHSTSHFSITFKAFITSLVPCDSATLALATRTNPFHLNRSFTRCCAINDWLSLRKSEGKTTALLVLQCMRLSGVRYYSNHSVEVSRALHSVGCSGTHISRLHLQILQCICSRKYYRLAHSFHTSF